MSLDIATTAPLGARDGRSCDPCIDGAWSDLADRSGNLFHSAPWLRVLRDAYGLRPRALVLPGGGPGEADAGVAWVEVGDARGRRLVSLPFSDFAGPIGGVEPDRLWPLLADRTPTATPLTMRLRLADDGAPAGPSVGVEDCRRLRTGLDLIETGRLAWHWAELPESDAGAEVGGERLWAQLASGARQNIRRSRKAGLRVEVRSDLGAVAEYHHLHGRLRKAKYRMLAQPWSFFAQLHRHFGPDRVRVVLARPAERGSGAEASAGVILLRHGDWAYYKLNASTPAGRSARANDAVMWAAMSAAHQWGCRWFDFGVSDLDQPGLVRYKNKYATGQGEVVVLHRAGGSRSWTARQVERALPLATRTLTSPRCPDVLGRQASRALYRLFC